MKNIRENVFETNSSSVHSLVIVTKEQFEALKNCDFLLEYKNLIPVEQAYKKTMERLERLEEKMSESYKTTYKTEFTLDVFKETLKKFDCYNLTYDERHYAYSHTIDTHRNAILAALPEDYDTYESYGGDMYETFCKDYTSKSGDEIVVFGYYGHD